ncbi:N-acyl-D-amino-acid deacylase family protein [Haliea sp. E17]|uniref:N-acyl-D-amino-acid deacylase family protein n=1 Tax=Haliea sp. E17 TaxID=3401576 RepID=UPI003AAB38F8
MTAFDTLIRGGRVIDGTGCPAYYADIGIRDGRIAAIGDLTACTADTDIDAHGKTVAPGHVAQHAHYDVALFWDPYLSNSGENGVTTVVNANCGFGVAPAKPEDRERTMQMLETTEQIPVAHQRSALPWDWESFPDYLTRIRTLDKGVNILSYLPLNPLLVYVMGVEAAKTRRPDAREMQEIHRLINEAMDAGAIGISMSSMGAEGNTHLDNDGTPMPTDTLDHDAILEICEALVARGEGVIQLLSHLVIYGDRGLTERVLARCKGTGVTVIHNAFITSDLMPDMLDRDLGWLDAMRACGYDLTANCFLHRGWIEAGMSQLDVACGMLNAVRKIVACKSDEALLSLLDDSHFVEEFAAEYAAKGSTNGANGLEGQIVIAVGDAPELQKYLDRTIAEIAAELGKGAVATMLELATRSSLALQLRSPEVASKDPRKAARMLSHTATVVGGSDGGAHTKSFGMGHVPTDLLIWLGREEQLLSQEELHFHLALKPARSVQIRDRGALLPGYWADILVYDLEALYFDTRRYEIVHDMPGGDWRRKGRAGGYEYILVNGQVTHRMDVPTGKTPGQLACAGSRRQSRLAAV